MSKGPFVKYDMQMPIRPKLAMVEASSRGRTTALIGLMAPRSRVIEKEENKEVVFIL